MGTFGTLLLSKAPYKNGKSGVQRVLHDAYKKKETSILVRIRGGADEYAELQACIVPNDPTGKKQYMLRSIADPNYTVCILDRTVSRIMQEKIFGHLMPILTVENLEASFEAIDSKPKPLVTALL